MSATDVKLASSGWKRTLFTSGNLLAGISVGAYFIPQAMAYGALAGIDVADGLAIAVVPLLVYLFLGRSRYMSVGPESAVALMAAAAVGPTASSLGVDPLTALAACSIMVGAILFLGWLVKASFLADLLSKPILVGYLTGVAILMVLSQLPKILNYEVDTSSVRAVFSSDLQAPDYQTVVIALLVLAVSLVCRKINPRLPGPLFGLVLAILLGLMWDVPTVGDVSLQMPTPQLSGITLELMAALFLPAISIAIVSFTDVMVTSRAFAVGPPPDPSSEMRALAAVQGVTGVAGGYPMSASSSRTALAAASGATSKYYSIIVIAVLIGGPLLIPGVISATPDAGLAGVILYAAYTLIDVPEWTGLARFRKRETAIAAVCAVAVVALGILPGVIVAIVLSVMEFLTRLARPHEGVLGFTPEAVGMHDIDDWDRTTTIPGLVVFRYDAPLFFMNAFDFYNKVKGVSPPGTEVVILNMEANVELDSTALATMEDLWEALDEQGTELWLARVKRDVLAPMVTHGVAEVIGRDNMYPTLSTALDAFREAYPELVANASDEGSSQN